MERIYQVKITRQAQAQIREIIDYIKYELCATDAADKLVEMMHSKIKSLQKQPERFRLIEEEPCKSMGVRKVAVKHFLVYYWVDEENRKVQVIAVIYEKRDQIARLKKIEF